MARKRTEHPLGSATHVERDAFKVGELAERTGLSKDFYWKKIREGKIKTLRMGSTSLIPASEYRRIVTEGVG
jgi:excisionase family DNA binding protein